MTRRSLHSGPAIVLIVIGVGGVVLGGLVAAVTEPLGLAHGSWLAAFLVLVGGVTQFAMGHARIRRPSGAQPQHWGWAQIGGWNLGGALVIGGTLASEPAIVSVGSLLLVVALVIALLATRDGGDLPVRPADWAYRVLLLALAVSIPIGMVLSFVRHS